MTTQVGIIGCGIIGAAIAYELSQVADLNITVLDRQPPAAGCTSAALGVMMGVISQKLKGRAWQLRQASMRRYETLIPELEAITGQSIPFNLDGILMLHFAGEDLAAWEKLIETRRSQGWHLESWNADRVRSCCPQLKNERIVGAIYSPQDRQVEPTALTKALVTAAQRNGVTFKFGVTVNAAQSIVCDRLPLFESPPNSEQETDCTKVRKCCYINTDAGTLEVDWLVIAAGLGSEKLASFLPSPAIKQSSPITIKPVLGQALQLQLEQAIGNPDFQPVITGDDVHIVPMGAGNYWVGATVEFPAPSGEVVADPVLLEKVRQDAIAFCPQLAEATIVRTWSGKRPRPEGRSAPVIDRLLGYSNVLLATGHYRNGILLAPATAQVIREFITTPVPSIPY
ncbi:MAG TPA: FAD-dependent oxidoreductase [Cyanobacteria bacterium UBA8803]|nr:FAD-dependent oxidoreductase [Cyanobacteria bacterium UBA9273]HBL58494.1 FAD-dependent oxidoreductase [Cyanobacteria bacterium UBA8803]